VPTDREQLETLLDVYLLERAIAELGHELNNDPERVLIPLEGIIQLLQPERPATA
jgi:maltose alpha-D-glucosyltransferase/alpha-amylase